jgi:hypothetical protein
MFFVKLVFIKNFLVRNKFFLFYAQTYEVNHQDESVISSQTRLMVDAWLLFEWSVNNLLGCALGEFFRAWEYGLYRLCG